MPEFSAPFSAPPEFSLEPGQVFLQGPDFYGMEACKISHSWDRKTFQASGSAKGLLAGTRRFFWHGECEKDLWVAGKKFWYQQRDFQSLVMEFSDGKPKQKGFFHSVVLFDRSPFKLFSLKFSNKSVQAPSCERPKTTQRSLFFSFARNNCFPASDEKLLAVF